MGTRIPPRETFAVVNIFPESAALIDQLGLLKLTIKRSFWNLVAV